MGNAAHNLPKTLGADYEPHFPSEWAVYCPWLATPAAHLAIPDCSGRAMVGQTWEQKMAHFPLHILVLLPWQQFLLTGASTRKKNMNRKYKSASQTFDGMRYNLTVLLRCLLLQFQQICTSFFHRTTSNQLLCSPLNFIFTIQQHYLNTKYSLSSHSVSNYNLLRLLLS
jgi:hypothetical protein